MAILDEFFHYTQKAGKTIADTATDVYGYTRASYRIAALENRKKELLSKIGAYTVRVERGEQPNAEELSFLMDKLEGVEHELEQEKASRAEIKKEVLCPACGAANPRNNTFCAACGEKLGE